MLDLNLIREFLLKKPIQESFHVVHVAHRECRHSCSDWVSCFELFPYTTSIFESMFRAQRLKDCTILNQWRGEKCLALFDKNIISSNWFYVYRRSDDSILVTDQAWVDGPSHSGIKISKSSAYCSTLHASSRRTRKRFVQYQYTEWINRTSSTGSHPSRLYHVRTRPLKKSSFRIQLQQE